jgi:hypothetical protein
VLSADRLRTAQQREEVQKVLELEQNLMFLELSYFHRDQQNKERESRYGLKKENKVLKFVKSNICGIFDDFACYKHRIK